MISAIFAYSAPAVGAECRLEPGSTCTCYVPEDLTFHPVAPGVGSVASPVPADRLTGFGIAAAEFSNTLGIAWTVVLSSVTTPSTDVDMGVATATSNGISELVALSDASWTMLGIYDDWGAAAFVQVDEPTCRILSADIYFKLTPAGAPWSNAMPSELPPPIAEWSFVQVMLHELGHAAGLAHENDIIGLMDMNPWNGGNPGIGIDSTASPLARLNADEQYIVSQLIPGGSTGREFLLYKFERTPKQSPPAPGLGGKSREIWTDVAAANPYHLIPEGWAACAGARLIGDPHPPYFPYAAMQSDMVEAYSATVRFGLSSTASLGDCAAGHQVAYNDDVQLVTGVPAFARPYFDDGGTPTEGWCIPTATPPGMYHVCAYVEDADSSDHDDEIYSDKLFEVLTPVGPNTCCRDPTVMTYGCDGVLLPVCP